MKSCAEEIWLAVVVWIKYVVNVVMSNASGHTEIWVFVVWMLTNSAEVAITMDDQPARNQLASGWTGRFLLKILLYVRMDTVEILSLGMEDLDR